QDVEVSAARDADRFAIRDAWRAWTVGRAARESAGDWLDALVRVPGARLRVARDRHDQILGFGAYLPLSRATLPAIQEYAPLSRVVGGYLNASSEPVAASSAATQVFCHAHVPARDAPLEPTLSALLRDAFDVLVQGGVHVVCSPTAAHQAALQSL